MRNVRHHQRQLVGLTTANGAIEDDGSSLPLQRRTYEGLAEVILDALSTLALEVAVVGGLNELDRVCGLEVPLQRVRFSNNQRT